MDTYEVRASRDGKFWLVEVPAIERFTQARNVPEIEVMARDLIAIMEDVDPDSFDISVDIDLPEKVAAALRSTEEHRGRAAALQSEAASEVRAAARHLKGLGLPLRDIGSVLGVSYQRAHQLVQEADAEHDPATLKRVSGS